MSHRRWCVVHNCLDAVITDSSLPASRLVALGFHDVCEDFGDAGFQQPRAHTYKLTPTQFAAFLDAVEDSGVSVLNTINDIRQRTKDGVVFTFDDAGAASLSTALMLEERGWRGNLFHTD